MLHVFYHEGFNSARVLDWDIRLLDINKFTKNDLRSTKRDFKSLNVCDVFHLLPLTDHENLFKQIKK